MSEYVYIRSEPGLLTVGFYAPDGKWQSESDHDSIESAGQRVSYLNGGKSPLELAAPDLLATLKAIVQPDNGRSVEFISEKEYYRAYIEGAELDAARVAIAKAEKAEGTQE